MLDPIHLTDSQVAIFTVSALLNNAATPGVTGTLTVSDYEMAYIAPTGQPDEYMLVPKVTIQPGETIEVSVDFSATAQDGSSLGAFALTFQVESSGVPVDTAVLSLISSEVLEESDVTVPADPGSATIPMYVPGPVGRNRSASKYPPKPAPRRR